jgi:hypothetical protein
MSRLAHPPRSALLARPPANRVPDSARVGGRFWDGWRPLCAVHFWVDGRLDVDCQIWPTGEGWALGTPSILPPGARSRLSALEKFL